MDNSTNGGYGTLSDGGDDNNAQQGVSLLSRWQRLQRLMIYGSVTRLLCAYRLNSESCLARERYGFAWGVRTVYLLWPPTVVALWLVDLFEQTGPNFLNAQGWGWLEYAFGYSRNYNHQAVLANLGGDEALKPDSFYGATASLLGVMLLSGLFNAYSFRRIGRQRQGRHEHVLVDLDYPASSSVNDATSSIKPGCLSTSTMDRIIDMLLGACVFGDLSEDETKKVKDSTDTGAQLNLFEWSTALRALATVIALFPGNTGVSRTARNKLAEFKQSGSCLRKWGVWLVEASSVQGNHPWRTAGLALFMLLARYHFYRIIISKFAYMIHAYQQQSACATDYADYMGLLGHYECVIDQDIYYSLANNAQGTVSSVLAEPVTLAALLKTLQKINDAYQAGRSDRQVTELDFRRQIWESWSTDELSSVIQALLSPAFQSLSRLDLAADVARGYNVPGDLLNMWVAALDHFPHLQELSFANRELGDQARKLLDVFMLPGLLTLNCQGVAMGDGALIALAPALVNSSLTTIDLSDNHLGYGALRALASVVSHSVLESLDLSRNRGITGQAVNDLLQSLPGSRLQKLQLSSSDLYDWSADVAAVAIAQSALLELGLSRCQLTDRTVLAFLANLVNASLMSLDLSHNPDIDDATAYDCLRYGFQRLDLSHNQLSDAAINETLTPQQLRPLQQLSFAGNTLTPHGAAKLFYRLPMTLRVLNISHTVLHEAVAVLSERMLNQSLPLTHLYLGYSSIAKPSDIDQLLEAIALAPLVGLDLSGQTFHDNSLLAQTVAQTQQLQILTCHRALMSNQTLYALMRAAVHHLTELYADEVGVLDDQALIEWSKTALLPYQTDEPLGQPLSIDQYRAISASTSDATLTVMSVKPPVSGKHWGPIGLRALCDVLYKTPLSPLQLSLLAEGQSTAVACASINRQDESARPIFSFSPSADSLASILLLIALLGVGIGFIKRCLGLPRKVGWSFSLFASPQEECADSACSQLEEVNP